LVLTVRTFRLSKAKRSKKYNQLVIPIYFNSVKQIAVRNQRFGRRYKQPALINTIRTSAAAPIIFILIGVAGIAFFGMQASQGQHIKSAKSFGKPIAAAPAKSKFMPRSEPTHLAIPSVGIDSNVTPVGKAPDGTIQTPPVLEWITGWYKYSPTPGQEGPAIIVGHVDNYQGISVFWKLRDVKPGDEIQVTRTDGQVAKFKVDALKQFDQAAFPTKEVYGNIDYAGLRLITCGGTFDKATESYNQNTVVYASMIT
jgi:sortase (surface protein transpeptidase)